MTSTPATRPDLPAQFVPGEVEAGLYARWVERGYFEADPKSDKPPFCIVIPPPNVTGSLHIGHAFEHTLIDLLVRRRRMQGYDALYLPGMDHASIAVHALVEKALVAEGTSRRELGREAFLERTWEWKAEHGGAILSQMRRLGESVDWTRERFTMDDGSNRAVRTMFKRLYDDGLIYRAERMVNWSPALRSVLSDIEVEHKEVDGELVSIRYGDGPDAVVVATTRVETMLGDTAVVVHPDDDRYRHLVGREIELPLVGRRIPILADSHVDPEFGTGAVKVTPAHDPNDFEIGRRHGLPMPSIMDDSGVITGTGTEFDGMDRFEARVAVREALRAQGRIVAEKRPYRHSVGHNQRAPHEPIEPRLSMQWFVKVGPLAKAAGDAVRDGRVVVHPKELEPRWFAWVDNMYDWCISRQLWWGHRIPVWYGPAGEVVCLGPDDEPPAGWTQDDDVLDTWFSSGLWPFSTLGWPDDTPDLRRYLPDVRAGHRLRHPVLLGRPDDDVRAVRDGRRAAVRHHRAARHGARRARQEDVEVGGQHGRPAGVDGPLRHRRGAIRAGPRREPGHGHAAGRRRRRRRPQLHHQAVERHPLRAEQRRDGRAAAARGGRAHRRRPLDPRAAARGRRAGRRAAGGLPVRQGQRGALPLHVGRVLRLVRRAGQAAAARREHGGGHPGRARARPGRAAQAAAPGQPVHHRDAVDGPHRR